MIRLLAIIAVLLLNFTITARASDHTDIKFDPVWRAHCEKRDYPLVNAVDRIAKVSETEEEVTFTFRSFLASCTNKVLSVRAVNPELVYVGVSKNSGLFGSGGVEASYDALPLETFVTVTFDKRKAFKDDRVARQYRMGFYPWGAFQSYFPWTILLTRDAAGSASLKIN